MVKDHISGVFSCSVFVHSPLLSMDEYSCDTADGFEIEWQSALTWTKLILSSCCSVDAGIKGYVSTWLPVLLFWGQESHSMASKHTSMAAQYLRHPS